MLKVLHLVNTLSTGGAELHLLTLCRHLKASGVTPVVACLRQEASDNSRPLRADFENEGVPVVNLRADHRFDWSYLTKSMRLLKEVRPQLLHTHLPRADIAGATAGLLGSRVPWVCSIHSIYNASWSGRWALPVLDRVWRRADQIVAISFAVKDWLVKQRGQLPENIRVVHYGIDAKRFMTPTQDLRDTMKLHGRRVIGSIGRLEPGKGHDILIRAMPKILRKMPESILLIAGHDTWGYGNVLQELIDRLALGQAVRLVGFQQDTPAFLKLLDVFAFASRSEGFGLVVVEAMAAAKPIVVSGIPPLTEMIVDRETGRLVSGDEPADWARVILENLQDDAEARRNGMRAQRSVRESFTAEKMTSETLALYDRVLTRRS